jgi:hypothetical protein
MPLGQCRLCGNHGPLCHSHVLPEFFYASTYEGSHQFVSVTDHPRHKPRRMQKGLREYLLCAMCESQFGKYESYAAALLRRADQALEGKSDGARIPDTDFLSFRLFGLSLLWRMHIASSHMFKEVQLGPHGERLRHMLQSQQPGMPHEYGFALAKVTGLNSHGDMILSPARTKYRGLHSYHFMARGYEWAFVVSSQAASLRGHFPFVASDPVLYVPTIVLDQSALFAELREAFPSALSRKQPPPESRDV